MVNRGRATIDLELDFSGKSKAAPYVERFLQEAMHRITDLELMASRKEQPAHQPTAGTNIRAVEETLFELVEQGLLSQDDYRKMINVLG